VPENSAAIAYAAEEESRSDGQPDAYGAFCDPRGRHERCGERKELSASHSTSSGFSSDNDKTDSDRNGEPVTSTGKHRHHRKNRELYHQTRRPRDFVVCLPHPLRPEVTCRGWSSQNVDVTANPFGAARGLNGANELEVLEHRASVVSVRAAQRRFPNAKGSRPVSAGYSIEQNTPCIPDCVKRQRLEIVLRPHDICQAQPIGYGRDRSTVVANIVVSNDHSFVGSQSDSGKNPADFSHRSRKIGIWRDVSNQIAERSAMSFENFSR